MENAFLVSYSLSELSSTDLANALQDMGGFKALPQTWIVRSKQDAGSIRKALTSFVGRGDGLVIVQIANMTYWLPMRETDPVKEFLRGLEPDILK